MAVKIETAIWLAIRARIETIPLSFSIAWPSEFFEVPFTGTELKPYIRVGRVSAAPVGLLIPYGAKHQRTGTVIVTLVHPIVSGTAVSAYDQIAATIAEHFKGGTSMSFGGVCVTVSSYPNVGDGYEDSGYWTVPVRIPWRCFA